MSRDPQESFKTHSNYIRAFSNLIIDPDSAAQHGLFESLKDRILASGILWHPGEAEIDLYSVRSSLNLAWGTEALLLMSSQIANEEELVRLSNNWSAIQTYYVFYHCTQSLHIAKGHNRPANHPTTQGLFVDYWGSRPFCMPPWTLSYGNAGASNTPLGFAPDLTVHPWATNVGENTWNLALKALMTTRRDALKKKKLALQERKRSERRDIWKRREEQRRAEGRRPRREPRFPAPRLSDGEKDQVDVRLRPFSIMDYFYRLRIRTNYEDSNMFTDGPEDDGSSRLIWLALRRLTSTTLFLHELAIKNLLGRDVFLGWVDNWLQRNAPARARNGLAQRRSFFD